MTDSMPDPLTVTEKLPIVRAEYVETIKSYDRPAYKEATRRNCPLLPPESSSAMMKFVDT